MAMQAHDGSCQCGAVTFSARVDLDQTLTCNCSRCQRLGSVLAQAEPGSFDLKSGEDALQEYRFHSQTIAHRFCRTCGIQPFAFGTGKDGASVQMITVNCLHGVDPRGLTSHHYDGASV